MFTSVDKHIKITKISRYLITYFSYANYFIKNTNNNTLDNITYLLNVYSNREPLMGWYVKNGH